MACKRCEISTCIRYNGIDFHFVTETLLSTRNDETKNVHIAHSIGFDVKLFPCQSRLSGLIFATIYKSQLGSNIHSIEALTLFTPRSK